MPLNTNQIKYSVIILAAGLGTRMKSGIPKVLHKVSGRTMLEHSIITALKLSSDVVIVGRKDIPEMKEIADKYGVNLVYQEQQLGTAHAAICGVDVINSDSDITVILYADTPMVKADTINYAGNRLYKNEKAGLSVFTFVDNYENQYGRIIFDKKHEYIEQIIEFKDLVSIGENPKEFATCNSGVKIIKTKYIGKLLKSVDNKNAKGEFYLTDIVHLARDMDLLVLNEKICPAEFQGVNNLQELALVNKYSNKEICKKFMDDGVIIVDPDNTTILCDVEIEPGVIIEPYCYISNTKIGAKSHIKSFSHIEGAEIDKNTVIGPYARIRPGSIICENAHIGSFVEVKASIIGDGSKANHLSYIGDVEIGKECNIGAGVIFCNYDGKKKHKSVVGDKVFIGSNSSIISPISIADKSMVAAGTVVTKNVEDEKTLVISRPEEMHIKDKAKHL